MRTRPIVAVACALVALASCRQIVGVDERNPAPAVALAPDAAVDAGGCSAPTGVAAACQSCLTSSCCTELTACGANVNCKRSFDCIARCDPNDARCAAACVQGFDAKLADALACKARSCGEPCSVACGGIGGVVRPKHDGAKEPCAACLATKLCAENNACAQESSCIQAAACPWRCALGDPACKSQCLYPLGPQPLADVITLASCRTECGMGKDWSCVGKSKYAVGTVIGDVPANVRFFSGLDPSKSVKDVKVRGCVDALCSAPIGGTCISDGNGYCSGKVPLTNPGGLYRGYIEATGVDGFSTLYFNFPPISGALAGDTSYCPTKVPFLNKANLDLIGALVGMSLEEGRGLALVSIFDCLEAEASDLIVEVSNADAKTKVFYADRGLPSPTAKATDDTGFVVIFNIPAGPESLTVTARLAATKEIVASSSVLVRANALTSLALGPQ